MYEVSTIIEATVSCFLMLQKYINSSQKNSEKKDYALYLGNISKDFTIDNVKKTGLGRVVNYFLVNFNPVILRVF